MHDRGAIRSSAGRWPWPRRWRRLDLMSGGRVVAGLGPGSSERDYTAAGIPFGERWPRFDEAVRAAAGAVPDRSRPFTGDFYTDRRPPRARPSASRWAPAVDRELGLGGRAAPGRPASVTAGWPRRTTRRRSSSPPAGGGSVSCWRTNGREPARFRERAGHDVVPHRRPGRGRGAHRAARARHPPTDVGELRERLPFGSAELVAERLIAFREAGVQRVFLWPVADEVEQLERFRAEVAPLLTP